MAKKNNTTGNGKDEIEEPTLITETKQESGFTDPLIESPTVERDYASPKIDNNLGVPEIEEPIIENTGYDFSQPDVSDEDFSGGGQEEFYQEEPRQTENRQYVEADAKTKKQGAEYMADTILAAYEALHGMGKKLTMFDESSYQKKAIEGKFDMTVLEMRLPLSAEDPRQTISVKEFLDNMNEGIDEALTVEDEFKERARPLLIQVLKKKGWGLTPEQQLGAIVIEDLLPKVAQLVYLNSNMKAVLELGAQTLAAQKESGANYSAPTPPPQPKQPDQEKETPPPPPPSEGFSDDPTPPKRRSRVTKPKNRVDKTTEINNAGQEKINRLMQLDDVEEPEEVVE